MSSVEWDIVSIDHRYNNIRIIPVLCSKPNSTTQLRLKDGLSGAYIEFDAPAGYFIMVVDIINKKVRIVQDSTVIAEMYLLTFGVSETGEYTIEIAERNTSDYQNDVKVDYVRTYVE